MKKLLAAVMGSALLLCTLSACTTTPADASPELSPSPLIDVSPTPLITESAPPEVSDMPGSGVPTDDPETHDVGDTPTPAASDIS